jgi:hypothetical protein|tara:strand:- start:284 stop:1006 length:723 start_codon:yes stop_codon:yes gene_type:complete
MGDRVIDFGCLIHGNYYSWEYVEILKASIERNCSSPIRFHVWTEPGREVPNTMIKHDLIDLGLSGPKKAWWYKTQLFNSETYSGPIIYMDLDVIITGNLDWMCNLSMQNFWAAKDFKCLFKAHRRAINSSIMLFDTGNYKHVWDKYKNNQDRITQQFHGDQNYIDEEIVETKRMIPDGKIASYRWEVLHGGMDMRTRAYPHRREIDVLIDPDTSIVVFHGDPKPHQLDNNILKQYWRLDK